MISEHNLISFYLDRFVKENTARGHEGSVQPAERTHTQSNSDHPNSSVVNSLIDLRVCEIDNPQYVAPDNADDIDLPDESQSWNTREAKITQYVDNQIPSQIFDSEQLRQKIQAICMEYMDIFSKTLSKIPAKLLPLELT